MILITMIKIIMINIKNDVNIYYNFGHSKIFLYFIFVFRRSKENLTLD